MHMAALGPVHRNLVIPTAKNPSKSRVKQNNSDRAHKPLPMSHLHQKKMARSLPQIPYP